MHTVKLSNSIDLDIDYNNLYRDIKSILHVNGTIDHIRQWWYGQIDNEFMNLIRHFYVADTLANTHIQDIISLQSKQK